MQGSADIVPLDEERSRRSAEPPTLTDAGAMLRAARIEAGATLEGVAETINVKADRLAAIEEMDLARLPSAPYTMGFVRAYADHLGLPVEPLVARFREEAGYTRSVTAPSVAPPPNDLAAGREVHVLGVLLLVAFVLWCVWQIVQAVAPDEAELPSGFPIADRTEPTSIEYEVATSLEEELRMTPPAVVAADEAGGEANPAPTGLQERTAQDDVEGSADADRAVPTDAASGPFATTAATDDAPGLLPSVLSSPVDPGQDRPTMNDPEPPTGADEAVTRSADLNERLLLEAMAGSAPGGRAADDGPGAPAVPDTGPITARAAPGTRTPPIGRPEAISPQAPPARTDQAPRARTDQAVTARPAPPPRAAPASALVPARLTAPVPPVYPSRCESRADDEEAVTVRFNVSRFGKVTSPSVTNSTNKCFDRAALAAVARFGFEAARRDGRPVPENGRTTRVVFRKP